VRQQHDHHARRKFDSTNDHKKFTPIAIEIAKYRAPPR
jgi:hypothetical protein